MQKIPIINLLQLVKASGSPGMEQQAGVILMYIAFPALFLLVECTVLSIFLWCQFEYGVSTIQVPLYVEQFHCFLSIHVPV